MNTNTTITLTADANRQYAFDDAESVALAIEGEAEAIVQASFNDGFAVTLGGKEVEYFPQCQHCESPLYTAIRLGDGRVVVTRQYGRGYGDEYGPLEIHRIYGALVKVV